MIAMSMFIIIIMISSSSSSSSSSIVVISSITITMTFYTGITIMQYSGGGGHLSNILLV